MKYTDTSIEDISFFDAVVRSRSLTAAARELQVSPAAVSKRLATLEKKLDVVLLNRSTRRLGLTDEGERFIRQGRDIAAQLAEMVRGLKSGNTAASGLLRVNATLGFGRSYIAPLVSSFVRNHPRVHIQLQLTVDPPGLSQNEFDVCVRFGAPPDSRLHAYLLAPNERVLCASPGYLAKHGTPQTPSDLANHATIAIRQGEAAYGVWQLTQGARREAIKVHGPLSSNDGEVAVNWALSGHGILLRSHWDVRRYLASGRLKQVLPDWQTPDADLYAVVPTQHNAQPRVRLFVEHLQNYFAAHIKS
jgi:LysR family transcriptional regulator, transcriptional activator for dmlA